jgi:hypothetical protein
VFQREFVGPVNSRSYDFTAPLVFG